MWASRTDARQSPDLPGAAALSLGRTPPPEQWPQGTEGRESVWLGVLGRRAWAGRDATRNEVRPGSASLRSGAGSPQPSPKGGPCRLRDMRGPDPGDCCPKPALVAKGHVPGNTRVAARCPCSKGTLCWGVPVCKQCWGPPLWGPGRRPSPVAALKLKGFLRPRPLWADLRPVVTQRGPGS